jgi:hypothetical protein
MPYPFLCITGNLVPPLDPVLRANMYNAQFNPNAYQSWGIPEYVCGSGNCTWEPTANLEVRSLCADISYHIQQSCEKGTNGTTSCNLTLSGGPVTQYSIYDSQSSGGWDGRNLISLAPMVKPIVYTNYSYSAPTKRSPSVIILHMLMPLDLVAGLGKNTSTAVIRDTRWLATDCSLELYVRSSNASIRNSVFHETTLATWSETVAAL